MTLRIRLSVVIGSLLASTLLVAGGALYWSEWSNLGRHMADTRESMVASFAQVCRDALVVNDELSVVNAAGVLVKKPEVLEAFCVDGRGVVFAGSPLERRKQPYGLSREDPDRGSSPLVGHPVVGKEKRLSLSARLGSGGEAVIVFSEEKMREERARALAPLLRQIVLVFSAVLVLGVLAVLVVAAGLSGPILKIAAGARQVAQGRLEHRIGLKRADEIGRLADDFDRMAERLGELDRMKNDFVANVTHELRSPLAAIESYSNRITDHAFEWGGSRLVDYVAVVRNNATRLGRFVNDLLDVAKIEAGVVDLRREPVDVNELFRETIALFGARASEKKIDLGAEGNLEKPVMADPDQIRHVMTNLVGNALKFTPEGGRVTLTASRDADNTIRLSVKDTGCGISISDQQRIFNRFEQVGDRRSKKPGEMGTGLGLSIAKGLVEAHGGLLVVQSEPGKGSVFIVSLPERNA